MWLNQKSLLNILSMRDVRKNFILTMDADVKAALYEHTKDGQILKSKEADSCIYMFGLKVKDNILMIRFTGITS